MIRITETNHIIKTALTRQIECDNLDEYKAVINSNLNTVPIPGKALKVYAWGGWQNFKEALSPHYRIK